MTSPTCYNLLVKFDKNVNIDELKKLILSNTVGLLDDPEAFDYKIKLTECTIALSLNNLLFNGFDSSEAYDIKETVSKALANKKIHDYVHEVKYDTSADQPTEIYAGKDYIISKLENLEAERQKLQNELLTEYEKIHGKDYTQWSIDVLSDVINELPECTLKKELEQYYDNI